jgi:hypothetical protein
MNKKLIGVIGISGALMFGSVYSISANTSGYDLYKDAFKKTHELQSTTMDVHFELEDNGTDLFTSTTHMKTNRKNERMNGTTMMSNGKETSKMEMFRQDGKWFVKQAGDNKLYKMESSKRKHSNMGERSQELQEDLEKLVDVLTKNLQQKIIVTEKENGTKAIKLELSKSEIPLAANVVSSLMIKHAAMMNDYKEADSSSDFHHVKPTLPELKDEITIQAIGISADINQENYVEKQYVKVSVSGKDASAVQHSLEMSFEIELSKVNKTEVKHFDLSNKKLEIIEVKHGR